MIIIIKLYLKGYHVLWLLLISISMITLCFLHRVGCHIVFDFGASKILNLNSFTRSTIAGPYGYLALGKLLSSPTQSLSCHFILYYKWSHHGKSLWRFAYIRRVTEKCYVYSFCVLVFEIIKREHPGTSLHQAKGLTSQIL